MSLSPDDKNISTADPTSDHNILEPRTTEKSNDTSISFFVMKAAAIACLGGIIFGYDMGVVSAALPQITTEFDLSDSQRAHVVSFLYIGAAIGATVGGTLCDFAGRRTGILVTDIIFILGALILAFAHNLEFVLLGRILVGLGASVSGIADVAYLHEISPERMRGAFVSCNEACISLGFLVSYTVGYFLTLNFPEDGWRVMFGLSAVIAVLQFTGMLYMPESPVWLASQGRFDEARRIRLMIHNGDDPERDVTEGASAAKKQETEQKPFISSETNEDDPPVEAGATSHIFWTFFKEMKRDYRQIIIALFLSTTQQFCGHVNVLNFAQEIFSQAGFAGDSSLASTLLLGIVKFSVTILVIWKIEEVGRRVLLLGGMSLISFSLLMLAISFIGDEIIPNLALAGALGVAMGYAGSFGPLTWLLTSEMFPTYVRGRALGISTTVTYICAAIESYTFLSWQSSYGRAIPFVIYCVVTLLSTIFAALSIPDTGGKSPAAIEAEMKMMWMWRSGRGSVVNNNFDSEAVVGELQHSANIT